MKTMLKTTLVLLVIFASFSFMEIKNELQNSQKIELNNDYCDGWEEGYCEGWKDVKGQYAICPVTPICPIPKIECNEGYKCGYNRGFKAGMKAAEED
jgi:hypothetical protein